MSEDRIVHIYALCEPSSGEVRYIGQAVNLNNRIAGHGYESRNYNSPKCKWIKDLHKQGLEPKIVILSIVPAGVADETEEAKISEYIASGARILNVNRVATGGIAQTKPLRREARTERIYFQLPPELRTRLKALATAETRQLSDYIRIVLEDHVQETRPMTNKINWETAVNIQTHRNGHTDSQIEDAAMRIITDIDRIGDESVWDWILNGDWTGKETPESVTGELEDIEWDLAHDEE